MTLDATGRKRILVADDTAFFRSMLSYILTEQGYEILTVSDGKQALAQLETQWNRYHLFILDLMMPGVNGFEVMRRLRELDPEAGLPVLVITQYFLNDLERQILKKHKIVGYLNKTASMERILFEVNTILYPEAKNIRKTYRAPVNLPVTFKYGNETAISMAFNLSLEGVFIVVQDREPPKVGSQIRVKFWIPNSEQLIETVGEVMWRNGFDTSLKKSHPPGIGVRFTSLPDNARQSMETFLKSLSIGLEAEG